MLGADGERIGAAIVGAQKCATTSLARMLERHPGICLAAGKEAHLFDDAEVQRAGPSGERWEAQFAHRRPGQLLLDATPSYLYLPGCVDALLRHSPEAKVIVVLRSPADRAVSHYWHERRRGVEQRSMLLALLSERRRLRLDADPLAAESAHRVASYVDRGRYDKQLQALLSRTSAVHVVLFDALIRSPEACVAGVVDFLGLAPAALGEFPRMNAGAGERSPAGRTLARMLLARSALRTEHLLGLPRGSLR